MLLGPQPLTLSQEARNTERHGTDWRASGRLRDHGIRFVSAGNLNQQPQQEANAKNTQAEEESGPIKNVDTVPIDEASKTDTVVQEDTNEQTAIEDRVQALDITAQESMPAPQETAATPLSTRSGTKSSSAENSDEDVVVFAGRAKQSMNTASVLPTNRISPHVEAQSSKPDLAPRRHTLVTLHSQTSNSSARSSHRPFETVAVHSAISGPFTQSALARDSSESANDQPRLSGRVKDKRRATNMVYADLMTEGQVPDEEDAIIRDYIANMKDFSDSEDNVIAESQRNGYAVKDLAEPGQQVTMVQEEIALDAVEDTANDDWDSADLDDLDELSTSEEAPDKIRKILKSRERPSGLQYLAVGVGQSVDEARWITQQALNARDAIDVLRAFEAQEEERMLAGLDDDDNDDDEDDDDEDEEDGDEDDGASEDSEEAGFNEYLDDLESEKDEMDLIQRRQARMTDEQIAQALAKQEELGLGADELLLFDNVMDDDILNDLGSARKARTKVPAKNSSRKGRRTEFPSAEAFADALDQDPYGAFDVMDFERPSLRPKKKGRKSNLAFELEDEELQLQIEQSWENDRKKKASKKREREELRAQGLLGSNNGRPALHIKYRNGMSTANIHLEIKAFLKSGDESLSLTAMDSLQRRHVHLLAHALKLKSKSQGGGASRYPILSKTRFTPVFSLDFSEDELDEILNNAHNPRQMYRSAFKGGKGAFAKVKTTGGGGKGRRSGGGGVATGAGYAEGEVVGATAPEIGIENRGRAMLEKMGWTKGMGLGAITNKGIVVPVQHVVKNSKAGLG